MSEQALTSPTNDHPATTPVLEGEIITTPKESRAEMFSTLCKKIPNTPYGLPTHLYRADLIPEDLNEFDAHKQEQILKKATIEISTREGYPTYQDGTPLWEQMATEDTISHDFFKQYLGQVDLHGVRQLSELPTSTHTKADLVNLHTYYFWNTRCKAYDLFLTAADQKKRERRILNSTNTDFLEANKLKTQILELFRDPDYVKALEPKDAVAALERVTKMTRIAMGLPAHGLATNDEQGPKGQSLEVTLTRIARDAEDPTIAAAGGNSNLQDIVENPELIRLVQQLTLKATQI